MKALGGLLLLVYGVLGYLAVPHTIWKGKIFIGTESALFNKRLSLGFWLGWFLIPWWFLSKK